MGSTPRKRGRRGLDDEPLAELSLGRRQDPGPESPLFSTRNLVPGLSSNVVKLDRLGKGATSNVFRAVHSATLKMVALKEVSVSSDADRRVVRSEVRTLRTQRYPLLTSWFRTESAACPRIVEYYGSIVQENGNACIAVEYVAGGSLGSWLERGYDCPEAWIAHISYQALEALVFLHSLGRVHRDVKPANLLVTRGGDLKLADFGAAGEQNSSRMVGTQRFMAPERLKGGPATPQSDLWSLGLTLATAALGYNPISQANSEFEQISLAEHAQRHVKRAKLSKGLRHFLHRCLARDPAKRPPLQELMEHPFLRHRHEWAIRCPSVGRAMRDMKRRQRGDANAKSTSKVLDALCRARANDSLRQKNAEEAEQLPLDATAAADLAYELGVSAKSLIHEIDRRTKQRITSRLSRSSDRREEHKVREKTRGSRGSRRNVDGLPSTIPGKCVSSSPAKKQAVTANQQVAPIASVRSSGRCSAARTPATAAGTPSTVASLTPRTRASHFARSRSSSSRRDMRRRGNGVRRRNEGSGIHLRLPQDKEVSTTVHGGSQSRLPTEIRRRTKVSTRHPRGSGSKLQKPKPKSKSKSKPKPKPKPKPKTVCIDHLADLMKAEVEVRDRVHRMLVYPACFSGREAVQWMIDGRHASTVNEALKYGTEMLQSGVFAHILDSHGFEDSSVYYQFTDGKKPPPPAQGGRRLIHIARVVRCQLKKKLAAGCIVDDDDSFEGNIRHIIERDPRSVTSSSNASGKDSSNTKALASPSQIPRLKGKGCNEDHKDSPAKGDKRPPKLFPRPPRAGGKTSRTGMNVPGRTIRAFGQKRQIRRRGQTTSTQVNLRRYSSGLSTATVPETPY